MCVTAAVNDKNSGLKLPAGTSVIQGDQALEFLRTRDSFFDGSDLGREQATHYFLSQMIQTLRKSKLNFSSLSTLVSIGQAAATATTVSNNYAGASNLEGLVESLDRVPTNSIALLTMPWEYDPDNNNRVVASSAAPAVFAAIQGDTSFTSNSSSSSSTKTTKKTASPTPTPAASTAAASVTKSQVPVNVYNADGVAGRATTIVSALQSNGFTDTVSAGNANPIAASAVYYDPNEVTQADADAVADALKISTSQVQSTTSFRGVSVFIGTDFQSGTTLSGSSSSSGSTTAAVSTAGAATAPADSHESFASDSSNECIPVESGNLQMASK